MNKLIYLSVFFVFLGINHTILHAQNSGNANVEATANVITALNVQNDGDLDFGQVAQGTTSTVSIGDVNQGRVVITGEAGVSVDVGLTATGTINELSNGAEQITITNFDISSADNPGGASPSSLLDASTTSANLNLSASTMYLFFTGEISASPTQGTGTYSNDYTVTVTYN